MWRYARLSLEHGYTYLELDELVPFFVKTFCMLILRGQQFVGCEISTGDLLQLLVRIGLSVSYNQLKVAELREQALNICRPLP